jgi:hypothetical protein
MKIKQGIIQTRILIISICLFIIVAVIYFFVIVRAPSKIILQETVATSTEQIETYGMNEYKDLAYGFSFWYPAELSVMATTTNDSTEFPGGIEVENLQVGSMGGTEIFVVNSPAETITDEPANHASPIAQTEYFYDKDSGKWMITFPQGTNNGSPDSTTTADISKTTMSGLIMLPSGKRFDTTIIPLSTTRFLVISDGGGSSFTYQLAQTISKIGSSIDFSEQESALQSESDSYASEIGCKTDSDCQDGYSCMTKGPLIANQPVNKVCVPKGQAVPL